MSFVRGLVFLLKVTLALFEIWTCTVAVKSKWNAGGVMVYFALLGIVMLAEHRRSRHYAQRKRNH